MARPTRSLLTRESSERIAARFGLAAVALATHRLKHLQEGVRHLLLDRLELHAQAAVEALGAAREAGDFLTAQHIICELRRSVELQAQLLGILKGQRRPTVVFIDDLERLLEGRKLKL